MEKLILFKALGCKRLSDRLPQRLRSTATGLSTYAIVFPLAFLLLCHFCVRQGFAEVCSKTDGEQAVISGSPSMGGSEVLRLAKASGSKTKKDSHPATGAPATNHPPQISSVYPEEQSVSDLRIGGSILFVVTAFDPDPYAYLNYSWYIDGSMKSSDASFMYAPGKDDIGTHKIEVKISDGTLGTSHQWSITVRNFSIEVAEGEHGSISPSGNGSGSVSVAVGSDAIFTIKPDDCYRIEDVLVDGEPVGVVDTYRFSDVMDDHAIAANFAPSSTYKISAAAREHGSISPSGTVEVSCGADVTFTITPHSHYEIEDVLVDGASVGAVPGYTFKKVIAPHTITATFIKAPVIEVSFGEHGSISPAGQVKVKYLSDQTFAITPDLGFLISDVLVDGDSVGEVESYTLKSVSDDHTLTAAFVLNEPPIADAGPDQKAGPGATVVLSAASSIDPDDGIASYLWEQTEGPAVALSSSTAIQPTFIAPEVGPEGAALTFQLTVTDEGGMQSVESCLINIVRDNLPPVAKSGFNQIAGEDETVTLDGSGSYDTDGEIASYHWEQVDGPTVTLSNPASPQPSFTLKDIGEEDTALMFRLTVTDRGGLKAGDFCIVNVTSENDPPTAAVGPDQNVLEGETVLLDGSKSSDSDNGGIASFRWKQVAGPPVTLASPAASRTSFKAPPVGPEGQSLTFLLIVANADGLLASSTCTVLVMPPLTVTSPNGGEVWHAGEDYTISWSFTENAEPRPDVALELLKGDSVSMVIARGIPIGMDGTGSYAWNIPSTQASGNDYRIRVLIGNAVKGDQAGRGTSEGVHSDASTVAGESTSDTQSSGLEGVVYKDRSDNPFTITEPAPAADFSATPVRGTAPLEVHFEDLSTGAVTERLWDFGDGTTGSEKKPVHTYSSSGVYTVTLKIEGPGGIRTEVKADLINLSDQPPVAAFSVSTRGGPVPLKVDFKDESDGHITSWSWDFGDGGTSEEQHPTHTYQASGTYDVTMKVEGPGGSDAQTITDCVTARTIPPAAAFHAAPTRGLAPLEVSFTDASTGKVTAWSWDFGDGETSTEQNPIHTYTAAGSHTVKLTVTGPAGEHSEAKKTRYISVRRPPAAKGRHKE